MNRKQKKMLTRILLSFALLIAFNIIPTIGIPRFIAFFAIYCIIGYDIIRNAFLGIIRGRVFDESFLMAVATIGAFGLAIYEKSGDYNEAIAVMLFYQTGELFQSYAVGKSRRNIASLMDIRPDYANIETDGNIVRVDPYEVACGSIIVVQPGEKIPIDGIVELGDSALDTSSLTGESAPRDIHRGDEVISGCINLSGVLRIRTTKEFGDSTVSKILELVENSSSRKSKSEAFISKFSRIYTPAVCCSALALALLPPIFRYLILGTEPLFSVWIYRALIFLVISCPCALVISIPLSFFAGLGGASREGILIKGSNYLETLSKVKTVVFDKTGTLTLGAFEVSEIHNIGISAQKMLEYAAYAESSSSHPIAMSIQKAYGKKINRDLLNDINEIGGNGVCADVDGVKIAVGNKKLMKRLGVVLPDCSCAGTVIHMSIDGEYAGYIIVSDVIKPNSRGAIDALRSAGVTKNIMLTGDSKSVAEKVAAQLSLDGVYSELLPADKVEKVEMLLRDMPKNEKLAFVGDGINDAPVLSRSDIGIAMGALGSDAAIEAADVVLMDDDPLKISKAIKISRKCISIVYTNIIFALGIKFLSLLLGAFGIANMWFAIFADVGVMVIAVLNSIRALNVSKL